MFAKISLILLGFPLVAAAELKFETTTREIDAPIEAREVAAEFPFTNDGSGKVVISRYEAACSCMSVGVKGGKLEYAPGEGGVLRGVFELGNFTGSVDKSVQVWLEGDPEDEPSIRLKVTVHIPEPIKLEPRTLRWDLGEAAEAKVARVRIEGETPIRVTGAGSGNEEFEVKLLTVDEGREYEVRVRPRSTESAGLAVVHVSTDSEIPRLASQRVFAVVRAKAKP